MSALSVVSQGARAARNASHVIPRRQRLLARAKRHPLLGYYGDGNDAPCFMRQDISSTSVRAPCFAEAAVRQKFIIHGARLVGDPFTHIVQRCPRIDV